MNIYVIRHGQTDYNVKGLFQGQIDIPLNLEGINQAKKIANKFKNIKVDKIFVSPLTRAKQTANFISEITNVNPIIEQRLVERYFGKLEGHKSITDFESRIDEFNIERIEAVEKRVKNFLENLFKNDNDKENIVIVTHATVIQIINKCLDLNYNEQNFTDFKLENAGCKCYKL